MISINIKLLFITLLINIINAEDGSTSKTMKPTRLGFGGLIIAVIIMLLGLINLITGKRLIKYLLFLNGLLFFAVCVIVIAVEILIDQSQELRIFQIIWIGVCAIFFGLIGGLLCCRFYRLGLGIMGLLMGHSIGEVISQAADLDNKWFLVLSWSLGGVLGIISAIFVGFMIVINTSFLGAQLFMLGIDYIVDKGYTNLIRLSINMKPIDFTPVLCGMLATSIIINLLGMLIQYKAFKGTHYYIVNVEN
jgi:hypothetical protein